MLRPLLSSTLFPYTTLFRSFRGEGLGQADAVGRRRVELAGAGLLGVPLAGEEALLLEAPQQGRSEEHTSELQSRGHLVCRLLLEKKKTHRSHNTKYLKIST